MTVDREHLRCDPTPERARASARRTGRNPAYPYVPVVETHHAEHGHLLRTETIRGLAFAERADAVAKAQRVLNHRAEAAARRDAERDAYVARQEALRAIHAATSSDLTIGSECATMGA